MLLNKNNDPQIVQIFESMDYFYKNLLKSGNEIVNSTNPDLGDINLKKVKEETEIIKTNEIFSLKKWMLLFFYMILKVPLLSQ